MNDGTVDHIDDGVNKREEEHSMEMLVGEPKSIINQVDEEDDERAGMEVGIDYYLGCGDSVHLEQQLEEEGPEDDGDGQLHAKCNFVYNFDVVLETRL